MALHRSKLVVGGSGGGGNGDGGVVVDLDPLSAFALMGQRLEEGTGTSGGAGPGSSVDSGNSSGGTTHARREQQTSSPPMSLQPATGGGWHSAELDLPAPSSRVRAFIFLLVVVGVPGCIPCSICIWHLVF